MFIFLLFSLTINAQSDLAKAKILVRQGNLREAESLLQKITPEDASAADAIELLGDICGKRKDWDCAIEQYSMLRKLRPSSGNAQYKFGGALGMKAKSVNKFRALAMIPDVREAFERAIELEPKHLEARWALVELNLQLPAIVGGSIKKANRYAAELGKLSLVDGYLAFARIAEHEENFPSAEKNYKLAWEKHNSRTAARKLAALYKKMNKPQKADAVLAAIGDH